MSIVSIKVSNNTNYHKKINIPTTSANGKTTTIDISKSYNHTYGFDFLELALLIVGILLLLELSKVRGIFYYVSLTLQELIEILLLLVIIYVILRIISVIVAILIYSRDEKTILSMEKNETEEVTDVKQEL